MKSFKHQSLRYVTPISPGYSSNVFTETNPNSLICWQQILSKSQNDRSRPGWRVAQFLELVEVHYKDERSVRFYAKQLFIHKDYLRQACKKVLERTPRQCLRSRLLLEARLLLLTEKNTIEEIAMELGCFSHSHFNHFFKKATGMSPTEYRKTYAGKC